MVVTATAATAFEILLSRSLSSSILFSVTYSTNRIDSYWVANLTQKKIVLQWIVVFYHAIIIIIIIIIVVTTSILLEICKKMSMQDMTGFDSTTGWYHYGRIVVPIIRRRQIRSTRTGA